MRAGKSGHDAGPVGIGMEEVDRLFSVGDLVDRGPESHHVLDWLAIHHERFSAGDRETCLWSADRYRTRYVQPIFCVGTWLIPRSQATKKPPQRVALVS